MRAPVRKELMKCFERELQIRWSQFARIDSEADSRKWSWKIAPNLVFFVTAQALRRQDQFVVEVAWNETEEFPYAALGLDVDQAQGRERLVRLWESGPRESVWDVAPEETARMLQRLEAYGEGKGSSIGIDDPPPLDQTLPRVLPLVCDALDKFGEHGMRLFRRVAEAHGVEWPPKQEA